MGMETHIIKMQFKKRFALFCTETIRGESSDQQRRTAQHSVIEKAHPTQMGQWKIGIMVTFNFLN